jgi:valyl-tRNA synthetase
LEGGVTAILPLAGVIDVSQELARLTKELERHHGEVQKLGKKLANQQFLDKAPEEVIAEQRDRLSIAEATVEKLGAAVDRLKNLAAD